LGKRVRTEYINRPDNRKIYITFYYSYPKYKDMAANRNVNVPSSQPPTELVGHPYVPLQAPDEWECIKICYVLFFLKLYKVLMKLHRFPCYKGLASTSDQNIHPKDLLGITNKENLNDPTGFMPNPIPPNHLQEAVSTRKDTDHLNLNDID
jgi:hypothetical protein